MDLNGLKERTYNDARNRGLLDAELSNQHYLCLVMRDLMGAVSAKRKGDSMKICTFTFSELLKHDYLNGSVKLTDEKIFFKLYDEYIKDTVEDKLADTAIGMLFLAGLRNVDMNDRFIISYVVNKKKTFTEQCYAIAREIMCYKYSFDEQLNYSIRQIFEFAYLQDIDLIWHINNKLRYNELITKN